MSANTVTATEAASTPVARGNPKDSMKSTWRTWDRKRWNHHQWMQEILAIHPTNLDQEVPKHEKTDKMPILSHYEGHRWIRLHAVWPLLAHQAYLHFFGKNLGIFAAFIFYTVAFKINAVREIQEMRRLGHKYGYLDGDKHDRDQVPDARVGNVMNSLISTATIRPMMSVFIAYRSSMSPLSTLSWWIPLEIGVYATVLDFWFYWYHRVMHESETLWKLHRTHHLTKHPTPLLSLYADTIQEIFDIVGIPILTYLTMKLVGLPMGFADWWVCQQYIVWTELWGHSGLRIFVTPPTTATPLLKLFDAELTTEDHDLHHRKGWKNSHNYGKQTRLWDRLFGTCHARIEAVDENIDWNDAITMAVF
jgi:sterol desaturase/sphingolipid hydroxylase (fatty acid hydroxylase superfamily)